MGATAHLDFIAAAYTAAVIVIGGLILWVTLDYRAQRRILAELEAQGVTRRSGGASTAQVFGQAPDAATQQSAEQAKEQA